MDKIDGVSKRNRRCSIYRPIIAFTTRSVRTLERRIDDKNDRPCTERLVITIFYRYQTRTRNELCNEVYSRLIFARFVYTDCV